MSTNPYAPLVHSSEPIATKRHFTSSGATILFAGFAVYELVWQGSVIVKTFLDFIQLNQQALTNAINAFAVVVEVLAWPFIPLGLLLFTRSCRLPSHQFPTKLRVVALGSSIIATPLLWYNTARYFFPTRVPAVNIDVKLAFNGAFVIAFFSITLLLARVAKLRDERKTHFLAILVLILLVPLGIAVKASRSTVIDHPIKALFETCLRLGPHALFLATIWSARKLEAPSGGLPRSKKRAKPKRRTAIVSSDKAV